MDTINNLKDLMNHVGAEFLYLDFARKMHSKYGCDIQLTIAPDEGGEEEGGGEVVVTCNGKWMSSEAVVSDIHHIDDVESFKVYECNGAHSDWLVFPIEADELEAIIRTVMKGLTEEQREYATDRLVDDFGHVIDVAVKEDTMEGVRDMARDGFKGYANMTDPELRQAFIDTFDEEIEEAMND